MVSDRRTLQNKKIACFNCGKESVETSFFKSHSHFYENAQIIPYCKTCLRKFYQFYYKKYLDDGCFTPEENALKRMCMAFDIYFHKTAFKAAMDKIIVRKLDISPWDAYMSIIQLAQYKKKKQTYDTTLLDIEKEQMESVIDSGGNISDSVDVDEEIVNFFGNGFSGEDYKFLKKEYDDWTARHECNTKAQEEVFKGLCFTQLKKLKAERKDEDTKDLDFTFLKQMEAAKLQPKQTKGDTTAETQTFGTLIDKWETTRPIPEVDEELKDVDKIGLLIHVFYTGHIAKVLGFKSTLTNLYDKFIKKYTVEKRESSSNSDNEALFDSIFGKKNIDVEE